MANTTGKLSVPLLLQEALERLMILHPQLALFARNYSQAAMKKGQTLTVKKVLGTVAQEFNGTFTAGEAKMVDAEIALTSHLHATYEITEDERNSGFLQWKSDLIDSLVEAIASKMYSIIFAKFTTGGASPTVDADNVVTVALANFSRTSIVDLGTKMTEAKVPKAGRFALLTPGYHGKLFGDQSIVGALVNPGAGAAITEGVLPRVHGFSVSEYTEIANTAAPHFIKGIAGVSSAIGVVAALPVAPSQGGTATTVTDKSGLSLQLREWSDWNTGKDYFSVQALFGAEIMSNDRLFALTSEAPVAE